MKKIIIASLCLLFCAATANAAQGENKIPYPKRAWDLNVNADVVAVYDVDAAGNTSNVRVLHNPRYRFFEQQVIKSINGWHFAPNHPAKNIQTTIKFRKNVISDPNM